VIVQVSLLDTFFDSGTTTRSASGNGNGASNTVCTTEKIAVVELMPRASVTMAARLKPTLRRSERTDCTSSCPMIDMRSSSERRGAG